MLIHETIYINHLLAMNLQQNSRESSTKVKPLNFTSNPCLRLPQANSKSLPRHPTAMSSTPRARPCLELTYRATSMPPEFFGYVS